MIRKTGCGARLQATDGIKTRRGIADGCSQALCAIGLLIGLFNVQAQTPAPESGARVTVRPALIPCTTPVTPETVVPWIELSALPDLSRDTAYFEHCSNIDNAWTTQSYPDPKFVPPRSPEQEARVRAFLQGIKDFVKADAEDWVAYVNSLFGTSLPPPVPDRLKSNDGRTLIFLNSFARDHAIAKFKTASKIFGVYSTQRLSTDGVLISSDRRLSISGLDTGTLCITPVDLQRAFVNQPGFLFRPMSIRTYNRRPNAEELARLGGQWFGYEVHVFAGPTTGKSRGYMSYGFQFKPCADRVQIELTKNLDQGAKQ